MTKEQWIVAVDPGLASGIVTAWYDEVTPLTFEGKWVTHNGVQGFSEWFRAHELEVQWDPWICEAFTLRASNKFVADLNPVEIIGFLKGELGAENVVWQQRTLKALVPDQVLKDSGEWVTGKMVGHTDGRDVNDAQIHALAYVLRRKHLPTIEHYFSGKESE